MKKIKVLVLLVIFLSFLVFPCSLVLAAELDQSFQEGPASDFEIHSLGSVSQTFIPTMPTLDWMSAYLVSFEMPRHVQAELTRVSNGAVVATGSQTISETWGWRSLVGGVTVVPGETYKMKLTSPEGNMWWRSGPNGYPSGIAYTPGANAARDMFFQTYGTPGSADSTPSPGASISGSVNPRSSGDDISPTSSGTESSNINGNSVFGFLDFNGSLWKEWSFWALVVLVAALIGVIIWFIVYRLKKNKKPPKITN